MLGNTFSSRVFVSNALKAERRCVSTASSYLPTLFSPACVCTPHAHRARALHLLESEPPLEQAVEPSPRKVLRPCSFRVELTLEIGEMNLTHRRAAAPPHKAAMVRRGKKHSNFSAYEFDHVRPVPSKRGGPYSYKRSIPSTVVQDRCGSCALGSHGAITHRRNPIMRSRSLFIIASTPFLRQEKSFHASLIQASGTKKL